MKIALITDTHHGARGDSITLLNHQKKFFDQQFFPYLEEHGIKTIVHLGDVFDRRKFINFHTSQRLRQDVLDPLTNGNYDVHILAGNHDVYYKSTNELNAFNEILRSYDFNLYTETTEISIDNHKILMVPWINSQNYSDSITKIQKTKSQVVFGHLELTGFEMGRGIMCDNGMNREIFNKFDMVFSGHFHQKSHDENIFYLGAPYQMTWSDYGSPRGFHIFDLHTRELQFIENSLTLFHRLFYNDELKKEKEMTDHMDSLDLKDCYIKVFVEAKRNPYFFDVYLDRLEKKDVQDIRIIEELVYDEYRRDDIDSVQDTQSLMMQNIDTLELDKGLANDVKKLLANLYVEATTIEIDA